MPRIRPIHLEKQVISGAKAPCAYRPCRPACHASRGACKSPRCRPASSPRQGSRGSWHRLRPRNAPKASKKIKKDQKTIKKPWFSADFGSCVVGGDLETARLPTCRMPGWFRQPQGRMRRKQIPKKIENRIILLPESILSRLFETFCGSFRGFSRATYYIERAALSQEIDDAVDDGQDPVHDEEALSLGARALQHQLLGRGQSVPEQVEAEGKDRMHHGLGVIKGDVASRQLHLSTYPWPTERPHAAARWLINARDSIFCSSMSCKRCFK